MNNFNSKMILILGSIFAAFFLGEGIVRLSRIKPIVPTNHMETWAQKDQLLGWRCKPGTYRVDCEHHEMTIEAAGLRRTTGRNSDNVFSPKAVIVLLGGSWCMGYGIRDEETLASRLQIRFPDMVVLNLATPGYGTYQSLLRLEEFFHDRKTDVPVIVLYEFSDHHMCRNVAGYACVKGFSTYGGSHLEPPHLLRNEFGEWIKYPGHNHNLLNMANKSHLIFFIQDRILCWRMAGRDLQAKDATQYCLSEMNKLCRDNSAKFVVLFIHGASELISELESWCSHNEIFFVNCHSEIPWLHPDYFLCSGDRRSGHPNSKLVSLWYETLSNSLISNGLVE